MSFYKGQALIKISLDTKQDLSGYDETGINYKKPDASTGTWPGTVSGTKIEYQFQDEDSPQEGTYTLQAYVEKDGLRAYGTTTTIEFKKRIL